MLFCIDIFENKGKKMIRIEVKMQILSNEREIKNLNHMIRNNIEIIEENQHDLAFKGLDYDWAMHMQQEIDDLTAENEKFEYQKHKLEKTNQKLRSNLVVTLKNAVKPVVFPPELPIAGMFPTRFGCHEK